MTYRELYRLLEEKLEKLRAASKDTTNLVKGYTSDLKRLERLQEDFVRDVDKALNDQFGATSSPAEWVERLEALGLPEMDDALKNMKGSITHSEKAAKQLVAMPDLEQLERAVETDHNAMKQARQKRDIASEAYRDLLEHIKMCEWARRLVKEGKRQGHESWESLQDRSFFRKLRDRGNRELQIYIKNLEHYRSDMARLPGLREMVGGDAYDPRDLVKAEQTLERRSMDAATVYQSAHEAFSKTQGEKDAWEHLQYEASENFQRAAIHGCFRRSIAKSEAVRVALGNLVKPEIQTKLIGGKEPWDEEKLKALWWKADAYREIIKYNQEALKGLEKAVDTLEKPYRKLRRKISSIGYKRVKKMDPEAIEQDLNAAVMAADYRNRWFRDRQRSFAMENDTSMNWLFWTSMYLVLSDSDLAFSVDDPALNEAMNHFREHDLTQFDLGEAARAGQLDVALSEGGLGDLSRDITGNLPDMSDLSSRLSSMDSGLSDLSSSFGSSFDSGSSFGGGGFDSGGSFGGGGF